MVWEASQKGVPFLGVPGNSLKEMGFYPKEFHHQIFSSPHPLITKAWVKRVKEDVRRNEDGVARLFLNLGVLKKRKGAYWDVLLVLSNWRILPLYKYCRLFTSRK